MTTVSLVKCNEYSQDKVNNAVFNALKNIGGIERYVKPGQRVLLKVNALTPKPPEAAVTTHPTLIKAVVSEVKRAGGIPLIGDSSGGMTTGQAPTRKTFEASGIAKAAEESGAELVNFDITGVKAVEVDGPIKTLYIAKPVLEADIVINLPKLKTHSAAVYTGAVKNMFGCIPGARKAEYHRKLPKLKDFSGLLVDIYKVARPSLAIMDAIVGMEGNGPSAGNPREIGLILASGDGVALDAVASSIIGLKPLRIHTTSIAHQRGIGNGDIDLIEIAGEKLNDVKIKGFNVPTNALLETMPGFLIKGVLSLMKAVPEINQTACAGCRFCVESCPVGAMKMSGKSPVIDYNKCISCLCCQELCPRKAVELKPANRLGRLIYTFAGHRKIKN